MNTFKKVSVVYPPSSRFQVLSVYLLPQTHCNLLLIHGVARDTIIFKSLKQYGYVRTRIQENSNHIKD